MDVNVPIEEDVITIVNGKEVVVFPEKTFCVGMFHHTKCMVFMYCNDFAYENNMKIIGENRVHFIGEKYVHNSFIGTISKWVAIKSGLVKKDYYFEKN